MIKPSGIASWPYFAKVIGGKQFIFRPSLHDENIAVWLAVQNFAVRRYWRGGECPAFAETLLIKSFAVVRVIGGNYALVRTGVERVVVNQRRGHIGTAALFTPGDEVVGGCPFLQGYVPRRAGWIA